MLAYQLLLEVHSVEDLVQPVEVEAVTRHKY
jgi:hypothetical protein